MKYQIDFRTFKWAVYTLLCMNLYYVSNEKLWACVAMATATAYIITLISDITNYFYDYFKKKIKNKNMKQN